MNLDGVEFLWSSEEINSRANEYWTLVMDIARKNNVKRITRYGHLNCTCIFK
jgi:tyrosyl-tRNA synthetase